MGRSSFTLLTALLFLFNSSSSVHVCPPSDRAALLAFRAALQEPYLGIFNSWFSYDCCHNWYGVSCDSISRRVAYINLRGESKDPIFERAKRTGSMTDTIFPEIFKLTCLSSLTIADWKGISDDIPRCTTRLPFLRILDFIDNKLSGYLPHEPIATALKSGTSIVFSKLKSMQNTG